ncbi:MAG: alginate lyase family protein [Polyangiales bacterium]
MTARDAAQELIELGPWRTLYRIGRETRQRSGLAARPRAYPSHPAPARDWLGELPFGDAREVARAVTPRLDASQRDGLLETADDALRGRILCFGRWRADYGAPLDWYLNPLTGARWPADAHWSRALVPAPGRDDVKLAWEPARFPQALHLARAAAVDEARAPRLFAGFTGMVRAFLDASPFPRGIHWASSQECAIRLVAWLFATRAFADLGLRDEAHERAITAYARVCGHHLLDEIGYARHAVYNNHLISEALGLCVTAWLCPDDPAAASWRALGLRLLSDESRAQVFEDGAYINQSHNYHRTVVQELLFASRWHRSALGADEPASWREALERSLTFLYAHQNPLDGRLPNFGPNDGSMPRPLSQCDFSDFRPTLQALSLHLHGERLYPPGPWDEEAAWSLGAASLDAPVTSRARPSVSFAATGYHVLRGEDPSSFACFRCGSVRERFGQLDLLHVDLWWRGQNVLVDGGTWLYSGPEVWHAHFLRTGSHNTVTVDGRDQMLHYRRFKFLYWAEAALLRFIDRGACSLVVGEHRGYARHPGGVIHRRSVLRVGDDLWIIADALVGEGRHDARLHWLCGEFETELVDGALALRTPAGALGLRVYDGDGSAVEIDVARGVESPPRGWLSRYFGERVPVTSAAVASARAALPWTRVTVVSASAPEVGVNGEAWTVHTPEAVARFRLRDGAITLEETS